jgi:Fic family protein
MNTFYRLSIAIAGHLKHSLPGKSLNKFFLSFNIKIRKKYDIGIVKFLPYRYYLCDMYSWAPSNGLIENHRQRIEAKKFQLDELRPLPVYVLDKLEQEMSIEWTYNSNAIEGNTLTLNETKVVLEQGITIGGKTLKEHFEIINHQNAIQWLQDRVSKKLKFQSQDLLTLHSWIMKGIDDQHSGRFRTGRVQITGANFIPPNPLKVPELIDELVHWVNENPQKLDPVALAAAFHHRLVWIHPFFDGNGRTGRLAMNLLLMQCGFPPLVILKVDRLKYYRALNSANLGEWEKLFLLFFQGMEKSLDRFNNAVKPTSNDDYLPLSQIAEDPQIGYGQEYLSLLARRGKIEAFKEGRVWYSTKSAIVHYFKN